MNTGRGIRTLSSLHGAYNPYSYQNGSVWPHDNSLIALGFKRYGFTTEVARIGREISDAASHFLMNQLPELYAGIDSATSPFPVQYLGANGTPRPGPPAPPSRCCRRFWASNRMRRTAAYGSIRLCRPGCPISR